MKLELFPISQLEAKIFIVEYHRHHPAPVGSVFQIGCVDADRLIGEEWAEDCIVGVIVCGRPVARANNDNYTLEVTRCCTTGAQNAPSKLYAAAWRAARALGYRKLITYTLPEEGGVSLRASGFKVVGQTKGGSWSTPSRPRIDKHPLQAKLKWEKTL